MVDPSASCSFAFPPLSVPKPWHSPRVQQAKASVVQVGAEGGTE